MSGRKAGWYMADWCRADWCMADWCMAGWCMAGWYKAWLLLCVFVTIAGLTLKRLGVFSGDSVVVEHALRGFAWWVPYGRFV